MERDGKIGVRLPNLSKLAKRESVCMPKDFNKLGYLVNRMDSNLMPVKREYTVLIEAALSTAAYFPNLLFDDELAAVGYICDWYLRTHKTFPRKWLPILDYLERKGV